MSKGNYAIVTDWEYWWIDGDEGPVNEDPYLNDGIARRAARDMLEEGYEIDPDVYYVIRDPDHGPDWDQQMRF